MKAVMDKAPEVRPKRPIYRSYGELIRILTVDAISRVKADKSVQIPPLKITAPMRKLAKQILRLRKDLKGKERVLSNVHKAYAPDRCDRDSSAIPIEYTYSERNRLGEMRPVAYQARMATIQRLRVKATLDTIDMTPRQAKHYLLMLERRLAKV